MKKILAILVLVLFSTMSFAQWSAGPGNLYMTGGNVGIGITAPTNDIQVNDASGPATFVLNTDVTVPAGSGTYTLGQYDMRHNGTTGDFYRNVLRQNRTNNHVEMLQTLRCQSTGQVLNFLFVDLTSAQFEMQSGISDATFKNNGNVYFINGATAGAGAVGIGMTQGTVVTPIPAGAKLAVGGKIVAKEIEVTLTGMPDFVFNSDYKLKSLYEVENFINLNKHLPDVPSEKEVTANGLNLGDMNATLLQKVEELTLYMIDLKKENDALKSRVSNLEK
ncbi:MAG: hypothetical protein NTW16_08990 [Bacteroidetes bacterium]|nr:hypothetical protein [Bacteroidota bacterium]